MGIKIGSSDIVDMRLGSNSINLIIKGNVIWPTGPTVLYETDWSDHAIGADLGDVGDGWDAKPDGWEEIDIIDDNGFHRARGVSANTRRAIATRQLEVPTRAGTIVEAVFGVYTGSDYCGIVYHANPYEYNNSSAIQHLFMRRGTTLEWGVVHGSTTGITVAGSSTVPAGSSVPFTMRAEATGENSVDLYYDGVYIGTHDTSGIPSANRCGLLVGDNTIQSYRFSIKEK